MAQEKEAALYYSPHAGAKTRKVKSVLVRLGVRIKNVSFEQFGEQVGTLLGLDTFPGKWEEEETEKEEERRDAGGQDAAAFPDELMVLYRFSDEKLSQLLRELRKSNAQVDLKAVLTDTNCSWTLLELYDEVLREHRMMTETQENAEKEEE